MDTAGAVRRGRRQVDLQQRQNLSVVQEGCREVDGLQFHGMHLWQKLLLHVFTALVAGPQGPLQMPHLQEEARRNSKPGEGSDVEDEPLYRTIYLQPGRGKQLQIDRRLREAKISL
jgi:hypothetical protein